MINQEEIGKRIAKLRKHRAYSQEELSNIIGITRPSLAQIEMGNRSVSAEEIFLFSQSLEFSIDDFLSPKFEINVDLLNEAAKKKEKVQEIAVQFLSILIVRSWAMFFRGGHAPIPNFGVATISTHHVALVA